MPVASPISRDLAINGGGLAVVGVVGAVTTAALIDGGPARAIIPFIIVALVFGLAQVVVSGGWLQKAVADAAAAPSDLQVEPDRARAIAESIARAQPADLVLIAGKGHEDYQLIGSARLPASDQAWVREALQV